MYEQIRRFNTDIHVVRASGKLVLSSSSKLSEMSKLRYDHTDGKQWKELARINGGLFDSNGACGWEVSDIHNTRTPKDERIEVLLRKDGTFEIGDLSATTSDIEWGYSVDALLLENGVDKAITPSWRAQMLNERHPRTFWGVTSNGTYVLCVAEGRNANDSGLNASECRTILKEYGCVHGFLNDGGGSSEMIVDGKIVNYLSDGAERKIRNALILYQPTEVKKSMFFRKDLFVTGSEEADSHKGTLCIDYGTGELKLSTENFAPFDCEVVQIDTNYGTVYMQSLEPVEFPKRDSKNNIVPTVDYLCCTFGHFEKLDPKVFVGARLKQGDFIGVDGSKGLSAPSPHNHVRFGHGKFKSPRLYQTSYGTYEINVTGGRLHHWEAFYVPNMAVIKTTKNWVGHKYNELWVALEAPKPTEPVIDWKSRALSAESKLEQIRKVLGE